MFNESQIISFDEIHCNNKEQVFFSILAIDLVASKKTKRKKKDKTLQSISCANGIHCQRRDRQLVDAKNSLQLCFKIHCQ